MRGEKGILGIGNSICESVRRGRGIRFVRRMVNVLGVYGRVFRDKVEVREFEGFECYVFGFVFFIVGVGVSRFRVFFEWFRWLGKFRCLVGWYDWTGLVLFGFGFLVFFLVLGVRVLGCAYFFRAVLGIFIGYRRLIGFYGGGVG